jgi:hypothetical protein
MRLDAIHFLTGLIQNSVHRELILSVIVEPELVCLMPSI